MTCRFHQACGFALLLTLVAAAPAGAFQAGDDQFPNSIMAPERGTARPHGHAAGWRHLRAAPPLAERPVYRNRLARGSSGFVLPTQLPRTPLIPPVGISAPAIRASPQAQVPTIVPSAPQLGPIPNLPHGAETFQGRASRCAFQQGLYGVPGTASNQYMGACVQ